MKTNIIRGLRTLAVRYGAIGLAAAVALSLGGANAALASNAPPPLDQAPQPPHVTIVPDSNPIFLAPGLTQGSGGVTIQTTAAPGCLTIQMQGGGFFKFTETPVITSHQDFTVFPGKPAIVTVFWKPQGIPGSCGIGIQVAQLYLSVYSAGNNPTVCIPCVSPGLLNALAPSR